MLAVARKIAELDTATTSSVLDVLAEVVQLFRRYIDTNKDTAMKSKVACWIVQNETTRRVFSKEASLGLLLN